MAASGCWLLAGCILYNLKERRKTSPRQINGVGVLLSWASGMSTAGDRGKGGGKPQSVGRAIQMMSTATDLGRVCSCRRHGAHGGRCLFHVCDIWTDQTKGWGPAVVGLAASWKAWLTNGRLTAPSIFKNFITGNRKALLSPYVCLGSDCLRWIELYHDGNS